MSAYSGISGYARPVLEQVFGYLVRRVLARSHTPLATSAWLKLPGSNQLTVTNRRSNVPEPQGRFLGLPYDLRRPTFGRFKSRFWNPDDKRVLTPTVFGWGYAINLYAAGSGVAELLRR